MKAAKFPKPTQLRHQVEEVVTQCDPNHIQCAACKKYGQHSTIDCNMKGPILCITDWLDKQKPSNMKAKIKDGYIADRKKMHAKYKEGFDSRKKVRAAIADLRVEYDHTIRIQHVDEQFQIDRNARIKKAELTYANLHFGNLDENFIDFHEPYLQIDPDTNALFMWDDITA